ncbi:MAG: hypothetical protein ABIH08_01410 [Candidatus Omnitrophota bacterium]
MKFTLLEKALSFRGELKEEQFGRGSKSLLNFLTGFIFLLSLILAFFLPVCFSEITEEKNIPTFLEKFQGKADKPTIICTPYGDIEKGSTVTTVMDIWGTPDYIFSKGKNEVWSYYFEEDECLFVHFFDGKVREIKDEEGPALDKDAGE